MSGNVSLVGHINAFAAWSTHEGHNSTMKKIKKAIFYFCTRLIKHFLSVVSLRGNNCKTHGASPKIIC